MCVFRAERERKVRVGHVPTHPRATRLLTPAPHGCLARLLVGNRETPHPLPPSLSEALGFIGFDGAQVRTIQTPLI